METLEELQLELIRDVAQLSALAQEWDVLAQKQPLALPFADAHWNILWWQHLHATRLLIHDQLHTIAFRNARSELVAIAPMMISARPGLGPFGIRVLQFFGADPNLTEVRGLICDPAYTTEVLTSFQHYLLHNRRLWDWIEWSGLSADQAQHLQSVEAACSAPRPMYCLPLPSSWEELRSGLSRNMKEAIRKCTNSLKRAQVEPTFRIVTAPDEVAAAMAIFFRLHKLRAHAHGKVAHADVFSDEKSRRFLSDYAMEMARQQRLCIFQLLIDDEVVATRIGFVCARQLYLYYSGYDLAWGRYSIMTTLVVQAIQWAIDQGFACVNLSTGRDPSKLRWQPQEHWHHNALQLAPRRQAVQLYRSYTHLRSYRFMRFLARS